MGVLGKFKNLFNMSEEEFLDDYDMDDNAEEEEDYSKDVRSSFGFGGRSNKSESSGSSGKVVDMRSTSASKANVVLEKIDRFEDVGGVADVLNERRIVILNLETCPNDVSVRIIDFLSGVAYANGGEIKRVAGRAYVITPYNVPLSGDIVEETGKR